MIAEVDEIANEFSYGEESDRLFVFNGYISRIKNDSSFFYPACTMEGCKRKVVEESPGVWRCESCNHSSNEFKPTYMFSAQVSDFTGSMWVSFAREQGNSLMGMTAEQFKTFKETKEEEFESFIESLMFKPVNIMVRGRQSTYNGETKLKFFAVKVLPQTNVKSENTALLKRLSIYTSTA